MEIKLCIDMSEYDIVMLIQASRNVKMPLDALIKKAILEYVDKLLTPTPQPTKGE